MTKRSKIKGSPKLALITGTLAFFIGFTAVSLFSVTVHKFSSILHLSIEEIGWLIAIPLLTGSLLRIPFGALVEKYGGKKVILTQLIIAFIGMLSIVIILFLNDVSYLLLLISGAIAGTGISTFSSGIAYVSYWFPQRNQGFALGTFAGIGNTSPGIFTVILPYLLSFGLTNVYLIWSLIVLFGIIIFFFFGQDVIYFRLRKEIGDKAINEAKTYGEEIFPSSNASKSIINSAKEPKVWLLTIMYLTSFGGFEALTVWLPTYWQNFLHISIVEAGFLVGILFSLLTALIRVLGGFLSDRIGGEKVSLISYSIIVLGSIIMITSFKINTSLLGEISLAIGMGIANGAVYKMVPKYASNSVGGASGLVGGLGSVGGIIIPPIMASIVNLYGYDGYAYGFTLFIILGLISILIAEILNKNLRCKNCFPNLK
ncbi:MFS transporter [Acidianus manzaensis]|uniref:MFS transporter n=1 Tax=Acidianus manzaensis TaxID=282676 RepID=A0A1W6JYS2_9CREN|nr:MFS transporter [Acidianus manzaensis]ARM75397.1 MFS transporter [Acidianus manzaensis]